MMRAVRFTLVFAGPLTSCGSHVASAQRDVHDEPFLVELFATGRLHATTHPFTIVVNRPERRGDGIRAPIGDYGFRPTGIEVTVDGSKLSTAIPGALDDAALYEAEAANARDGASRVEIIEPGSDVARLQWDLVPGVHDLDVVAVYRGGPNKASEHATYAFEVADIAVQGRITMALRQHVVAIGGRELTPLTFEIGGGKDEYLGSAPDCLPAGW